MDWVESEEKVQSEDSARKVRRKKSGRVVSSSRWVDSRAITMEMELSD